VEKCKRPFKFPILLPKSLPLDEVTRCFKVKIFLDSFNELPREYWERGSYEADFAKFTTSIGNASFVIGSRTSDGLNKLGLPTYSLDQLDEATVTAELQRLGIEIGGRFDREVRSLLQRLFYFQYVTSGAVRLAKEPHPRDFYQGKRHAGREKRQGDHIFTRTHPPAPPSSPPAPIPRQRASGGPALDAAGRPLARATGHG
jgi:hypothetical protein